MNKITYRKAEIKDCLSIATLKGIVWNTTYRGIYSDESLINYDVVKNQKIFEQIVNNPEIEVYVAVNKKNYKAQKFYWEMGGNVIYTGDSQIHFSYSVSNLDR